MKDEEFQKKLELILEKFYDIDREVKEYFSRDKFYLKNQDYNNSSNYNNTAILDDQYKNRK